MKSQLTLVTITLCATTGVGCYSTWDIAPTSVVDLNGLREEQPKEVRIEKKGGGSETVEITTGTDSLFRESNGTETVGTFRSIDVHGDTLVGVGNKHGTPFTIDTSRLQSVRAEKLSVSKTVGLSVGLTLGIPSVAIGILFAVLASTGGFGGGRPLRLAPHASPTRAPLLRPRAGASRLSRAARVKRGTDEATRRRMFAHWANETSAEGASIPAFLALARDLRLASAPSALVEHALRAAREEASHTALCAELANEHTEAPIMAWIPDAPPNTDSDPASLLKRLAVEAFEDGCLAEGAAAAVARRSALFVRDVRDARDEAVARALHTIARDEQGHADLAQNIMDYCLSTGGRAVRDALAESLHGKRQEHEAAMSFGAEAQGEEGFDEDLARRGGVPGIDVMRAAQAEVWEKSARRLARL